MSAASSTTRLRTKSTGGDDDINTNKNDHGSNAIHDDSYNNEEYDNEESDHDNQQQRIALPADEFGDKFGDAFAAVFVS